jgi:hypothetical protein
MKSIIRLTIACLNSRGTSQGTELVSLKRNVLMITIQWYKRKKLLFCNLCKSFLYNNSPDPTLFAPKDGLHLNYAGTDLLRKKIIDIIRHLSVHFIYDMYCIIIVML